MWQIGHLQQLFWAGRSSRSRVLSCITFKWLNGRPSRPRFSYAAAAVGPKKVCRINDCSFAKLTEAAGASPCQPDQTSLSYIVDNKGFALAIVSSQADCSCICCRLQGVAIFCF